MEDNVEWIGMEDNVEWIGMEDVAEPSKPSAHVSNLLPQASSLDEEEKYDTDHDEASRGLLSSTHESRPEL